VRGRHRVVRGEDRFSYPLRERNSLCGATAPTGRFLLNEESLVLFVQPLPPVPIHIGVHDLLDLGLACGDRIERLAVAAGDMSAGAETVLCDRGEDLPDLWIVDQTMAIRRARIAERGGNVYAETTRYNYSPVWSLILRTLPDPIHVSARVLVSVADVINGLIIGAIAGARARTFYLFNPLSILLVGYGGQFEALAIMPLLLALRFPALLWPLATAAIFIKHDVAFLAWLLYVYAFPGWRAWLAMLATSLVFLATFIPFLPGGAGGILRNVFLYQSIMGVYGFGALLPGAFVLFVGFVCIFASLDFCATS